VNRHDRCACGLRTVDRDGHTAILRLLADRHHDLTGLRTQSACRLHVMLRERLAYEHLADIRRIDADIDMVKIRIRDAVIASGTTLCELHGVGPVVAAVIIGHVHDIGRFRTRAQFASYNGTAPIEASRANAAGSENPRRIPGLRGRSHAHEL
jgi:transposase